jgi:hypothetical protein
MAIAIVFIIGLAAGCGALFGILAAQGYYEPQIDYLMRKLGHER